MPHSLPDNFLGLPADLADEKTARFVVLPIPYDATTTFGLGTRDGPRAIITASQQVELYDEALSRESHTVGVATLPPLEPDARGPLHMVERVFQAARPIIRADKFLISLGGEHSITSGLVRAVQTRHRDLSVLQIDAHADLRDEYQRTPYSHAAVMRRVHDLRVPAVGVGIRNYSRDEARFIRRNNKLILSAERCRADAPGRSEQISANAPVHAAERGRTSRDWIGEAVGGLTDHVYVTIDIDGFDPAYAPGTGTPEPGGLDWYQVTELLAAVARSRQIVAADVVEVRPIPPNTITEFLAAKLIYRLIGLVTG